MLDLDIDVSVVKPPTQQLIVEQVRYVIEVQWTLCNILGDMRFNLGLIKLMKYLCVLHFVVG